MMGVTLGLVCAILALLVGFLVKSWRRPTFPGPRGIPFIGPAGRMWRRKTKDIIPLFKGWYDTYGDIFELEVLGMVYVFLAEPEVVEPILTSSTNITKGYYEYSFFRPMFNDGLILSDGDKWRSRRKLLTPSFHFKILESSLKSMHHNAQLYVSSLLASGGKPIEIEEIIFLTTLKIICETAMGVKLDSENKQQNEYIKASKDCVDGILERYLRFWQYPEFTYRLCNAGKKFFESIDITHNFDKQVIRKKKELFQAEKKKSQNNGITKNGLKKAFLDTILELEDANPGLFTESDIMEEVDTFLRAGHHTIASAIMFAHFLLANHPDVQEKLYKEQLEVCGEDGRMPTIQELNKMIYMEMVIKETLRLYPSVPLHTRFLKEDLHIDENRVIKAGQSVVVFTYTVHRSKNHWDNPDEFIPERFAPGIERHPFSFIPFSAGPRNCIGQKYAMTKMKTVLSAVVRHCRLEPVTTSIELDYGVTLKPSGPIFVKAFPRANTDTLST